MCDARQVTFNPDRQKLLSTKNTEDNKVMMVAAPSESTLDEVIVNSKEFDQSAAAPKKSPFRRRLRIRPTIDILIIILVGLLVFLIEYGYIPDSQNGFICKDPSISHRFTGDTVTVTHLLLSAYFGPLLIILLVELLRLKSVKKICVGTVWWYYKECLVGATFVLMITEVIKVLMSEPRPHFIDSCDPDMNKNCINGTLILEYKCLNTGLSRLFKSDMTKSFPSGHTSITMFVALYCSYLVQIRIPSQNVSSLTKPFLILVCLTWTLVCSLTRITDRRHHWWDVLAGAFLGIFGALYTLGLLHGQERKQQEKISRSSTTMTTLSEIKKDSDMVI